MKSLFFRCVIAIVSLLLASCASGYKSFYTPVPGATPEAIAATRASPPPAMPILERAAMGNPDAILDAYMKRGYLMIGNSQFNSGRNESESSALTQGKAVGADLVLVLNPQYTGSITTAVPITTPTSTTSYTTGSASAYGPGGQVNAYGNATTTTYGSRTTYMPMTVNRSDYGAVYFVKVRSYLGAFSRDLNDTERKSLQTNQGTVVYCIVDDSPAFKADLLPGDIITAMAGVKVQNTKTYLQMIYEHKGKETSVTLIRDGKKIDKTVQINGDNGSLN